MQVPYLLWGSRQISGRLDSDRPKPWAILSLKYMILTVPGLEIWIQVTTNVEYMSQYEKIACSGGWQPGGKAVLTTGDRNCQ